MGYTKGEDRQQLKYISLEDFVPEESMVRVIDKYIEILDLEQLGFINTTPPQTGRPCYPPKAMCKLYLYGYENGIRSSRKLEKETQKNVEVMWLLGELKPDHKTISNFRKNNVGPMQKLFQEFVKICKEWELIEGEIVAIDGTKIRASNNKKTNFSKKKLDARISRIEDQINTYLKDIDENDQSEEESNKNSNKLVDNLIQRKRLYEEYLTQMEKTGVNEISQVDPDARLMGNNRGGVDVSYNVQSAVDGANNIVLDYDVILNPTDQGQLSNMVKKAQKQLNKKELTVVADKGYYNGEDLEKCKSYNVKTIVSRQKPSNPKDQPKEFHTQNFKYNEKEDTYTCYYGKTLYAHGSKDAKRRDYHNREACKECPHVNDCTSSGKFRRITRSQYSEIYEEVDKRTTENMALYKRRQMIVEHPFGTIKYTLGGYYFLLRTRRKVKAEVALLFLAYNMKRAYKILGFKEIMERLDNLSTTIFLQILENWAKSENYFTNLKLLKI